MPALSVVDLAMFLLETTERPFNIGPLVILTPPAAARAKFADPKFADRLTARMLKRPVGAPFNRRLRWPLVGVPSLDVVAEIDPTTQVHRLRLEAPGSMKQLFAKICDLHRVTLDRSRLLWELYVIDGLEGGKVALYGKVHHGIIDGRTFVKVMSNWLSDSPKDRSVRAMWEGVAQAAGEPRAKTTRAQGMSRLLGQALGTAGSAASLGRMLAQQALASTGVRDGLGLPFLNVSRAFDGPLSGERSFAYCALPLDRMKTFGKGHDATVNDVFLTALDLGMERYLRERRIKLARPLVADMAIALKQASGGNQIAVIQLPLGAPGTDPLARLAAVRRQTGAVKEAIARYSSETAMLYTTLVHGLPAAMERLGLKGARISNLVVSNPFGLTEKRYLMGAEAELVLPISVVAAGQLLNVTAVTLAEKLQIGFLGVPAAVPEIDRLAACTEEAFEQLLNAGASPSTRSPRARKARRTPAPAAVAVDRVRRPD